MSVMNKPVKTPLGWSVCAIASAGVLSWGTMSLPASNNADLAARQATMNAVSASTEFTPEPLAESDDQSQQDFKHERVRFERSLHRSIAAGLPPFVRAAIADEIASEFPDLANDAPTWVEGVDPLTTLCFAPGTPQEYIDQFRQLGNPEPTGERFFAAARWTATATNGGGIPAGVPITLTYSFVPDGTNIPSGSGFPSGPSNFQAWMNGIYGNEATWQALFAQSFDRWHQVSGITYVFEPNDDGVSMNSSNSGVLGVRGDIRIGGRLLDGNGGVLAYNSFPNNGNMVFDTGDNFYNTTSNNSIRLRNVIMHEHGHGMGLAHNCPALGQKLMEPFINISFSGPQHDDIRAAQFLYGDPYEPNGNAATATPLGELSIGQTVSPSDMPPPVIPNTSITSIERNGRQDWFRFSVAQPASANITVTPLGLTYQNNPQSCSGEPGSCCSGQTTDSLRAADLAVQVLAANGTTVLGEASSADIGFAEILNNVPLQNVGNYYVRVYHTGTATGPQMYRLDINIDEPILQPATLSIIDAPMEVISPGATQNVVVSLQLNDDTLMPTGVQLWRVLFGPIPVITPMTDMGNGLWSAELPAVNCGDQLFWWVTADTQLANQIRLPAIGAFEPIPAEQDTLFADDFSTDLGWTVVNTPFGTGTFDGAWERGEPAGDGSRGDPATCFGGSGSCYLTGNRPGNSDVDHGATTLTSPVIDASGYDNVIVSYARWFSNNTGASPETDTFDVEVSADGGTQWVELEIVGPTSSSPIGDVSGGWVFVQYDLTGIVPATAGLRVRFTASDSNPQSLVEAAVDAFSVVGRRCVVATEPCPCDRDGDSVQTVSDYFAFLTEFFEQLGGPGSADLDGDGVVTVSDFFDFLNCLPAIGANQPCP